LSFNKFINKFLKKLQHIIQDYDSLDECLRNFYFDLCHYNYIKLHELTGEGGTSFELELANDLMGQLFENAKEYSGTTIYPPHNHYFYFPNLLSKHEQLLNQYNNASNRFVIIKKSVLYASYKYHSAQFYKFVDWHKNHKVGLWQIDPQFAENLRSKINEKYGKEILTSVNLAFWRNHCAVQCDLNPPPFMSLKPPDKERKMQVVFPRNLTYHAIADYVDSLSNHVKDHSESNSDTFFNIITFLKDLEIKREISEQVFPKYVADSWKLIEGLEKRVLKSSKFLNEVIQSHYGNYITERNRIKILSAAGTLGFESVILSAEGYSVTYNEPRDSLFNAALRELEEAGRVESILENYLNGAGKRFISSDYKIASKFNFKSSQHGPLGFISNKPNTFFKINDDMKSMFLFNESICYLEDLFQGDAGFDIVMLLGNYISVYDGKNTIDRILKILRKTIKPGGILIIDHRNYEKIELCFSIAKKIGLSAYDVYLKELQPVKEECPEFVPYTSEYIFTGEIPFGPVDIIYNEKDFNRIVLKAEIPIGSDIKEPFLPHLTSIKWKEFRGMLDDAGFVNILSFGDQETCKQLDSKKGDLLQYDFITHVCTNPS
jgi:hypothetical protein